MASIKKVSAYLKFETVEDERAGLSLDEYIEKYQIVWVLTDKGNPLFVMSDLAESKGNNARDYMNVLKRFEEEAEEAEKNSNLFDYRFSDAELSSKEIAVCNSGASGIQSLALEILTRVVECRADDYYYLQQNVLPKVRHILQKRDALMVIQRAIDSVEG